MYTKKCIKCNTEFTTDDKLRRFCSCKCAAYYNNNIRKINGTLKHSEDTKHKISATLKTKYIPKIKHCKICGNVTCKRPDICKQYLIRKKSINLQKLGFDFSAIGSTRIIEEFEKLNHYLFDLYVIKLKSLRDICDIHHISCETSLCKILDMFNIKRRTNSESLLNYCLNDKYKSIIPKDICKIPYKHGWHTTWDNNQVYYRSSYELEVCQDLDKQKIHYEMEFLRIPYYDSQLKRMSVSIVDFYIPVLNKIIEVKSSATYNKINMIDRFKQYKKMGYTDYNLYYEHKNFGKRLPETQDINSNYYKIAT